MTDLTKLFMDKAQFLKEFSEGLECAFIQGLGVWKLWWGLVPRRRTRVQTEMVPVPTGGMGGLGGILQPASAGGPFGQSPQAYAQQSAQQYPTQLPGEALNPAGWSPGLGADMAGFPPPPSYLMVPQKQVIQEEVMEGQLFIRAVDPYNFYWLPGSKLNRWVGTLEDIEVPRWELLRMAEAGLFPVEKVRNIRQQKIDEHYRQSRLRFSETQLTTNGPNEDTGVVKLTEYYGPLVWDGRIVMERAHVVLANDSTVLVLQNNPLIHRSPPYIGFSPLNLPFRTEGVGLIEQVRFIDRAMSQLANLSMDTLTFRLLPLFEVAMEALENPEDIETGIVPGKLLRKNLSHAGVEAIKPVQFQDISSGAVQVWSALERSHQEGALISDVAEGLPRWRGQQTATETELMQGQSESFMGGMASDIENEALEPMVGMAMDLIFQFLDTANDPRVASILGVGADMIKGMSREEILEMISGDYKVKVSGITGQLMKAEQLQNLVQFMNLIGQNPEAWLPHLNQDALLRRILECFRPHIHDIEEIIADPATAEAKRVAMLAQQQLPELLGLLQQQAQATQGTPPTPVAPGQAFDAGMELQRMTHEREMQQVEQQAVQQQQAAEAAARQAETDNQLKIIEAQAKANKAQPRPRGAA
jgi:hypothetical protein